MNDTNNFKIGDKIKFPDGYFSNGNPRPILHGTVEEIAGRYIKVKILEFDENISMPFYAAKLI